MRGSFDEGREYFSALVQVFSTEIRKAKNKHLELFYVTVPALTLSFVDSMLAAKDHLKKDRRDAFFTDDGFAMGLAYLLRLLDQDDLFESLGWWETVKAHYAAERSTLHEGNTADVRATRREDANSLALERINSYVREFELLEWAFGSARMFFRS